MAAHGPTLRHDHEDIYTCSYTCSFTLTQRGSCGLGTLQRPPDQQPGCSEPVFSVKVSQNETEQS